MFKIYPKLEGRLSGKTFGISEDIEVYCIVCPICGCDRVNDKGRSYECCDGGEMKTFNDLLAILYLIFVLVWVAGVLLATKFLTITTVDALGLGTATGVLLAILKDVFQFYFRTRPTEPNTTSTVK